MRERGNSRGALLLSPRGLLGEPSSKAQGTIDKGKDTMKKKMIDGGGTPVTKRWRAGKSATRTTQKQPTSEKSPAARKAQAELSKKQVCDVRKKH